MQINRAVSAQHVLAPQAGVKKPAAQFASSIPVGQHDHQPAVQFGASKGGLVGTIAAWVSALGMLGGYSFFAMTESNPPGVHSVIYDATNNGHQEKVHGPGLVWLGPLGMAPLINPVHNAPLSTSDQFVVENIKPSTQEQRTIPNLQIGIDFSVNPEYLRTVMVDTLGGIKGEVTIPESTAFANTKDPNIQKVYIQLIRPSLTGMINDLSTTYRGENYHKITDFLTVALNQGFPKYPVQKVDDKGLMRTIEVKNIQSLQKAVGDQVTIHKVYVTEIKLPQDIATKLEEQAKQPLQKLIAGLSKELEDTRAITNKAEGEISAAEQQEQATQEAAVTKLAATGKIEVETHKQTAQKTDAEATATYNNTVAETGKLTTDTLAKAQEEAANILSAANTYSATTKANADALEKGATANAAAELAKLKGVPYQKYGQELLTLESIEGSSRAIEALANNPNNRIYYIDPGTGLKVEMLNIGNGQGINPQGLINHIVGEKASHRPETPQPAPAQK